MDEQKKIIDILKDTRGQVDSWLKFAEAKMATLLGFNLAFVKFACDLNKSEEYKNLKDITIIIGIVIIFLVFWSMFPNLINYNSARTALTDADRDKTNLLFYRDIRKYTEVQYIKELYKRYLNTTIETSQIKRLEKDIAQEIIINSNIAYKKYWKFELAVVLEGVIVILCILIA